MIRVKDLKVKLKHSNSIKCYVIYYFVVSVLETFPICYWSVFFGITIRRTTINVIHKFTEKHLDMQ